MITNLYLTAMEAETLPIFAATEIRKTRYYLDFEPCRYSIDMFIGDLFGLVLAETGFESDEEMDNFPLPSFALADVTNHELFTGGRLSELTFADIQSEAERSGVLKKSVPPA